jgi:hypothetical protein
MGAPAALKACDSESWRGPLLVAAPVRRDGVPGVAAAVIPGAAGACWSGCVRGRLLPGALSVCAGRFPGRLTPSLSGPGPTGGSVSCLGGLRVAGLSGP